MSAEEDAKILRKKIEKGRDLLTGVEFPGVSDVVAGGFPRQWRIPGKTNAEVAENKEAIEAFVISCRIKEGTGYKFVSSARPEAPITEQPIITMTSNAYAIMQKALGQALTTWR